MSKLVLAGARRRQPLVVLSLMLNMLLLGASVLWWSGAGTTGPAGVVLGSSSPHRARVAAGFETCEPAQLDIDKLQDWGCKLFEKVCLDQDNVILHSGLKTPDHPNFTHNVLFDTAKVPAYVLPGYAEPMGTPHFTPKCWDLNIRGPTALDQPDIRSPTEFSKCAVPMVWWLTYFSIFSDLYIGSVLALDLMKAEGAYDRNVLLAPISLGMDLPRFYEPLLRPYTKHKVVSYSHLSSREHMVTGQPRCFERAILCNMVGMYTSSPKHHWGELKPKLAGRRAVEFYRQEQPQEFLVHDKLAAAEKGTVFRVAFMPRNGGLRIIRNLKEVLAKCKKWKVPAESRYRSVDCVLLPDGSAENHIKLVAQVQNVHALVNTHGSGNAYAFFMPNLTGLVEIMAWNFHGKGCTWGDQYFSDWYNLDYTTNSGYFRLVADHNHTFPGPYEQKNLGSGIAYGRDKDVEIDFPTLAKALEKIALGQLYSGYDNIPDRTFYMTRKDVCPGHAEWLKKHANGTDPDQPAPEEVAPA